MDPSYVLQYLGLFMFASFTESAIVQTKLGPVKGWESASRDGKPYLAFTKIPYAKPPVGKLRLKYPEPVEPWTNELDATEDAPKCPQVRVDKVEGQEDCLYLNIYSPKNPKNLPVIAYIHGGAYQNGYPGPRQLADYFMDENVILITMHYRLGVLGFLSLEEKTISGNFGLKDQALALEWVKNNIESFGGDPKGIVIFGESAGGSSTNFHMYSDLAKDYIKGVISESGVVNHIWALATPGKMKENAIKIAKAVNCPTDNPDTLLDCLQNIEVSELVKTQQLFNYWGIDEMTPLRPYVDTNLPGGFFKEDPFNSTSNIPWITGVNSGEALLKTTVLTYLMPPSVMEEFAEKIDELTAKNLQLDQNSASAKEIVKAVKARYFKEMDLPMLIDEYGKFFSDMSFRHPMLKQVNKHSGPVFIYHLEHRGEGTIFDILIPGNKFNITEPCHGDDLLLLFNMLNLKGNDIDKKISKEVVKMWANFAEFQDPNPPQAEVVWPKYDKSTKPYLRITTDGMLIGKDPFADIYEFWEQTLNKQ